jgi:hypothetical protein
MASTYSNIKIQLMATGENTTTWGDVANVNLGTAIEEAIVGSADVAFSNDNVTLTLTDTNSTQAARNMRLNLTGTATTGYNLIVPAIEKPYIINNGTDGTITIKNSTGTGVAVPAGKTMWVYNNGTNVVDVVNHVTSLTTTGNAIINGSVGIGTSSPSAKLQVSGAVPDTPTTFNVNHGASGNDFDYASSTVSAVGGINGGFTAWGTGSARAGTLAVGTGSNHPMTFMTNDTEHMRIDTGGNVGIGTTVPGGKLEVSNGASDCLVRIRGGTAGSSSPQLQFYADSSDHNWTLIGNHITALTFNKGTFGAVGSELMRIDSNGNLLVGTTLAGGRVSILAANNTSTALVTRGVSGDVATASTQVVKFDNNSTGSQIFTQFLIDDGNTGSGLIAANGGGQAAFASFSDAELKENITDLPAQLDNVLALRPVEFDYIESEGGGHQIGFIAQEIEQVFPDAVGEREDGMKTVAGWTKTEAILVKAIQELTARVAQLEGN